MSKLPSRKRPPGGDSSAISWQRMLCLTRLQMMWAFGNNYGPYVPFSWALPPSCRISQETFSQLAAQQRACTGRLDTGAQCHSAMPPYVPHALEQRAVICSSRSSQAQIRFSSALVPNLAFLTPQEPLTEKCVRPSVPVCLEVSSI